MHYAIYMDNTVPISGIIPVVGSINDDIGGTFPSIEWYIGRHFETQAGVLLRFSFSRTGSSNFTPILNSWMIFMICMNSTTTISLTVAILKL